MIKQVFVIMMMLCTQRHVLAAAPHLVIVPAQQASAPVLDTQVITYLNESFAHELVVLPFAAYLDAAGRLKLRPSSILGPEAAVPVGQAIGATHVLLVETVADKPLAAVRANKKYHLQTNLIDAHTGETLLDRGYPLESAKKIANATGLRILKDVMGAIGQQDTNQNIAPVILPPPTVATATPPIEPAPQVAMQPIEQEQQHVDAIAAPVAQDIAPATEISTPPTQATSHVAPLYILVGGGAFTRQAKIAASGSSTPPCYCSSDFFSPLFGQAQLRLAWFPFDTTKWFGGLGLNATTSLGLSQTSTDGAAEQTNPVLLTQASIAWRWFIARAAPTMDISLRLGYAYYGFALKQTVFPSLNYRAPYAGLATTIPIAGPVHLLLAGSYLPWVKTGDAAYQLGSQNNAWGYQAEAGLRINISPMLDITALAEHQYYHVPFAGPTNLSNASTQWSNALLTETIHRASLLVGLAF